MNDETKNNVEPVIADIIGALDDRGGFDAWWDDIDEDIQDEIKDELVGIVAGWFKVLNDLANS